MIGLPVDVPPRTSSRTAPLVTGHASEVRADLREGSHRPDHGHDKYKRTLAGVLMPDGTNVNHELAKNCWWWYLKYAPGGFGAGRIGARSARGEERFVGRSASNAALGVAEEEVKILVTDLPEESPAIDGLRGPRHTDPPCAPFPS